MMVKERFCLLDADHILVNNEPVVRLFGVTEKGKNIVVFDRSFRPYFYVEPKAELTDKEIDNLKERISGIEIDGKKPEKVETVERKILGKETKLIKVTVTNPSDVQKFRDIVKEWSDVREEYEYAMSFYKRYIRDKGLIPMSWVEVIGEKKRTDIIADFAIEAEKVRLAPNEKMPKMRIMAFDTEVVEENGEENIIMISIVDNRGFKKLLTYKKIDSDNIEVLENEKEMIRRFVQIVKERNPNIIVGYNTDRFDFLKLDEKAKAYGILLTLGRDERPLIFRRRGRISSAQIRGRVHIDLYDFVEHILAPNLTSEVLTLDMVSKEILGKGKEKIKWKEIEKAWETNKGLEKVAEYCNNDAKLTLMLADHILPIVFEICKVTSLIPFDASRVTYSQLVEALLVRRAYELGEIALNRPKHDEVQRRKMAEPYTGGYVHPPKKGIHENIALFDFQSLYPSIIVTFNISPETLDCNHRECKKNKVPDEDHYFCTKRKGFIPIVLEEVIKKRIAVKRQMKKAEGMKRKDLNNKQFALKILANSFYGYLGYASSRWYSRVCAKSAASFGRFFIKKVIKMAEDDGFEVLYGDTDSLFLKVKTKKQAKEFLKKVNNSLPGIMELDFKGIYKRGIFIEAKTGFAAKKKYALLDEKGNLVIRGMETRRRDWAEIAKKTQERVLEAVLKQNSKRKAIKIINETIKNLKEGNVDIDDLIIYTQLTKPLSEYEQIGPHVAAAKKIIARGGKVGEGSTIAYIITKGTGSISDRAEPAEDAKDYDPEYYINNQVIPAAMRILKGLDLKEDELKMEEKQKSLEGFFK